MKRRQAGLMAATLVLLMALSGGTAWGATVTIDIEYDWDGKCVSDLEFVDQGDKYLTLSKKAKKIKWNLVPKTKAAAEGDWEILATSPAELCESKYKDNSSKTYIECKVEKAIKYEYDLMWSDDGCNNGEPVVADPVIIFDDGGGDEASSALIILACLAGAAVTLFVGFKWGKWSAAR